MRVKLLAPTLTVLLLLAAAPALAQSGTETVVLPVEGMV